MAAPNPGYIHDVRVLLSSLKMKLLEVVSNLEPMVANQSELEETLLHGNESIRLCESLESAVSKLENINSTTKADLASHIIPLADEIKRILF